MALPSPPKSPQPATAASFTVLASTNLDLPSSNWTVLGCRLPQVVAAIKRSALRG